MDVKKGFAGVKQMHVLPEQKKVHRGLFVHNLIFLYLIEYTILHFNTLTFACLPGQLFFMQHNRQFVYY